MKSFENPVAGVTRGQILARGPKIRNFSMDPDEEISEILNFIFSFFSVSS